MNSDHRAAAPSDALRISEEKFESVVENMSEGLMIFDKEGNVTFHNSASARLHGIERTADGLFRGDELPVRWRAWDRDGVRVPFERWPIARVLRGERFQNQFLHAERADTGMTFDAVYNGASIRDANGNFCWATSRFGTSATNFMRSGRWRARTICFAASPTRSPA